MLTVTKTSLEEKQMRVHMEDATQIKQGLGIVRDHDAVSEKVVWTPTSSKATQAGARWVDP